jgi:hypothetical protein
MKKKIFTIVPHKGVSPIWFGMSREQVKKVIGKPLDGRKAANVDCFYQSDVQISYGTDGLVEFVEIARNSKVFVLFENHDLMKLTMKEASSLFQKSCPVHVDYDEYPATHLFVGIDVCLWRSYVSEEHDYFESIGVGKKGCYQNMLTMLKK